MPTSPYPTRDPHYTGISIAFRNSTLIADEVFPRVPVSAEEFRYIRMTEADGFTVPSTLVGRKSSPNEVEFGGAEVTGQTQDHGLQDVVPQRDIDNAIEGHDPLAHSTEFTTDLVLLGREVRAAALAFAPGNFASANKVTLTSGDKWSAKTTSDPVDDIMTGLDVCIMRPNIMVIGQEAWRQLSTHPAILKAVHGNDGDSGVARRQAIAELFELEDIYIGRGWLNNAKPGQSMSLARVWTDSCLLAYRNRLATPMRGATFGFTAQFGDRVVDIQHDGKIGLRGGKRVKVGESVKEVMPSDKLGYLISDCA